MAAGATKGILHDHEAVLHAGRGPLLSGGADHLHAFGVHARAIHDGAKRHDTNPHRVTKFMGFNFVIDDTMPENCIEVRDGSGRFLGAITNIEIPKRNNPGAC